MQAKLIDIYLIQTIEENPSAIFEVKEFLSKLNKPEAPNSIVDVFPDVEPLLEKTAQHVKLKKEYASRLDRRTEAMLQQQYLVSQPQSQNTNMEVKAQNKDQLGAF